MKENLNVPLPVVPDPLPVTTDPDAIVDDPAVIYVGPDTDEPSGLLGGLFNLFSSIKNWLFP